MSPHSHPHNHLHIEEGSGDVGKKLLFSIALNFAITAVQVVGGLLTGSLSLIGDAMHNLADTFSLVISYFAIKLSGKKKTERKTFGYERVEILVALLNSSILIVVSFFLFKEAFIRLFHPVVIDSKWVILIASFGLVANSACAFLLQSHVQKSMNVRSAFIHLVSDALVSLVVVVGAVIIYYFNIFLGRYFYFFSHMGNYFIKE
ncbi:MAG: cation diffusion facilitator family transporter [Nitrospinae bacterium]|nr:cation diffusion facilitator family transporter [Nitrospinota bacterium]